MYAYVRQYACDRLCNIVCVCLCVVCVPVFSDCVFICVDFECVCAKILIQGENVFRNDRRLEG